MKDEGGLLSIVVPVASAVAIAYVYVFVLLYLGTAETLIAGNIHDYFLPLNAAYVTDISGLGQEMLRSPFGPLYFLLSTASFNLIRAVPEWLSLDKIHAISSLQASLVVVALFFLFRNLQDEDRKFPLWLLAFSIMVCFQPRDVGRVNDVLPDWFGTYNNHLWAVLLLQAANHYAWRGRQPGRRTLIPLAVLEAVCLGITFNYKISFFAASACLALLPLSYVGSISQKLLYAAVSAAVFLLAAAVLAAAGFSYAQYFQNLRWAAEGKSLTLLETVLQLSGIAALLFVAFVLQCEKWNYPDHPPGARGASVILRFRERILQLVALIGFDLVIGGAMFLAAIGEYRLPVWPYVVMAACAARWSGPAEASCVGRRPSAALLVQGFAGGWLVLLMGLGLAGQDALLKSPSPREMRTSLYNSLSREIDARPLRFVLRQITYVPSLASLAETGLVDPGRGGQQALFDLSYQLQASEDRTLNPMLSAMLDNGYVDDLNAAARWLRHEAAKSGQAGRLVIGSVGFANPYPFLTGNLFPRGSLHWMHLGTSLSLSQLNQALAPLAEADVVIVPALTFDSLREPLLRCGFYLWNERKGGLFVPQATAGVNMIFLRKGGLLAPGAPIVEQDRASIERICKDTLSEPLPLG